MSSMEILTLVTGVKLLDSCARYSVHDLVLYRVIVTRVSFLMHLLGESLNNELFNFSKCFAFSEMLVQGIT